MERGQSINRAFLVLVELTTSLNAEEAPELARNLSGLYAYMQKRLLEANLKQKDAPLAEVLCLLSTLEEAWKAIPDHVSESEAAPVARRNPWAAANAALMEDEPVRLALSA
jgi:flagellar protein FliS